MIIEGSSVAIKYCVIVKTLLVLNGTAPTVQNCVVYDTEIEAKASCTIQNTIGRNTLLPAVDIDIDTAKTVTGQHNCFQDAAKTGSGTYADAGTLWNTDPLMADPANDDFTLTEKSPCIDAGALIGLLTDYAGNLVGRGGAYMLGKIKPYIGAIISAYGDMPDIGAYEWGW